VLKYTRTYKMISLANIYSLLRKSLMLDEHLIF